MTAPSPYYQPLELIAWQSRTEQISTPKKLMLICSAEDQATDLLTAMLRSVGYTREDVIIGSADQLTQHQPSLLLILGEETAQRFLNTAEPLDALRGRVHDTQPPMIITYSPSELTLTPENKKKAYHDLQLTQKTFANFA